MDSTLVTEQVVQHFIKCMDYHQLKTVINQLIILSVPIVLGKLKAFRNHFYTLVFISLFPKFKYEKGGIARRIVYLREFDYEYINDIL